MILNTFIDYTDEGPEARGECLSYTREVQELDPQDFLWYTFKLAELLGFKVDQMQMVSGNNIYKTDW